MRWLPEAGWVPTETAFEYAELVDRAVNEFGYHDKRRARALIAKAARRLRGEFVSMRGERPQTMVQITREEYATLKAKAGKS